MGKPFEKFREERIYEIQESIAFFSNANKRQRDLWVAKHFLSGYLPMQDLTDVCIPDVDPPDIVFKDMNIEVKEILDPDRRRHDELRDQLEKARRARKYADFLSIGGSLRQFTTSIVLQLLEKKVESLSKRYSRSFRESIDLLFYVNLRAAHYAHVADTDQPAHEWEKFAFRSISFVFHRHSFFVCATECAPSLLRENIGKPISRLNYF